MVSRREFFGGTLAAAVASSFPLAPTLADILSPTMRVEHDREPAGR